MEGMMCNPDNIKSEIINAEDRYDSEEADKQISDDDLETGDFDETSKASIVSWTQPATMRLIQYYKKYRPLVGTGQVKNLKKLFEVISQKINKDMKSGYSPSNCENRWRVLQRKYKKYQSTSKTSNKQQRFFEFAKDMAELVETYNPRREEIEEVVPKEPEKIILGPKLLLYPNVVLNPPTVNPPALNPSNQNVVKQQNMSPIIINNSPQNMVNKNINTQPKPSCSSNTDAKCNISQVKSDKYHERKLHLERERLELKKHQLDLYKEYQQKKLDEKIRKNRLLEERNQILRDYLRNNVNIPHIAME